MELKIYLDYVAGIPQETRLLQHEGRLYVMYIGGFLPRSLDGDTSVLPTLSKESVMLFEHGVTSLKEFYEQKYKAFLNKYGPVLMSYTLIHDMHIAYLGLTSEIEKLLKERKIILLFSPDGSWEHVEVLDSLKAVRKHEDFSEPKVSFAESLEHVIRELTRFGDALVGMPFHTSNFLGYLLRNSTISAFSDPSKPALELHNLIAFLCALTIKAATFGASPRKCPGCGYTFMPNRRNQISCSTSCRVKSFHKGNQGGL